MKTLSDAGTTEKLIVQPQDANWHDETLEAKAQVFQRLATEERLAVLAEMSRFAGNFIEEHRNLNILESTQRVFAALESHDVKYVVIGGFAVITHGVPRLTADLDLFIEATSHNAQNVLAALLDAGYTQAELVDAEGLILVSHLRVDGPISVDLLIRPPGIDFAEVWSRKEVRFDQGQPFNVISRLDLIAAKKASGRPVDLSDAQALEALDE